jgi:hypothetical protein
VGLRTTCWLRCWLILSVCWRVLGLDGAAGRVRVAAVHAGTRVLHAAAATAAASDLCRGSQRCGDSCSVGFFVVRLPLLAGRRGDVAAVWRHAGGLSGCVLLCSVGLVRRGLHAWWLLLVRRLLAVRRCLGLLRVLCRLPCLPLGAHALLAARAAASGCVLRPVRLLLLVVQRKHVVGAATEQCAWVRAAGWACF